MATGSGLNRISMVVPGSSSNAAAERDLLATNAKTQFPGTWTYLYYTDTASGNGAWGYYIIGLSSSSTSGTATVVTISCSGMTSPPSGSDIIAMADPGVGTNTWSPVGAVPSLMTSAGGGGGGSAPAQNSNYMVWHIPASAAADFTNAITSLNAIMPANSSGEILLKYVDSVSGAWAVYCLFIAPGITVSDPSVPNHSVANQNFIYVVTCSGTPHPPTGSGIPAIPFPGFTQTFTTITAPLQFGPMR